LIVGPQLWSLGLAGASSETVLARQRSISNCERSEQRIGEQPPAVSQDFRRVFRLSASVFMARRPSFLPAVSFDLVSRPDARAHEHLHHPIQRRPERDAISRLGAHDSIVEVPGGGPSCYHALRITRWGECPGMRGPDAPLRGGASTADLDESGGPGGSLVAEEEVSFNH